MLYELITVEHADPFQAFFVFENFICIFYGKVTQEEYDMAKFGLAARRVQIHDLQNFQYRQE